MIISVVQILGTHNLCAKDLTHLKPSILFAQVRWYIMYSKLSLYIYSMINDKRFACLCYLKFVFSSTNASYGNCSMPFFLSSNYFFSLRWSRLCCRVQDMFINMFNLVICASYSTNSVILFLGLSYPCLTTQLFWYAASASPPPRRLLQIQDRGEATSTYNNISKPRSTGEICLCLLWWSHWNIKVLTKSYDNTEEIIQDD